MTTITIYKGNLRTEITHVMSGVKLITDAPVDNQGEGKSFSPSDLLATSLSSCMFTIMGIAARTHGFSIDGATAKTSSGAKIQQFFVPTSAIVKKTIKFFITQKHCAINKYLCKAKQKLLSYDFTNTL